MAKSKSQKNTPPSKKSIKKEQSIPIFKRIYTFIDDQLKKIVGVLFILISIFLFVSFFSYFTTWKLDQDKVLNYHGLVDFLFNNELLIQNTGGRLGAFLSHQLIYNGFGVASIAFPFFLGIWGLNLLLHQRIASTIRTFFYSSLVIILLSPVLAYFLPSKQFPFPWGGQFGNVIIEHLRILAGNVGTTLIMIGLALVLLILIFNPIFRLPFWHRLFEKKEDETTPVPALEPLKVKKSTIQIDEQLSTIPVHEETNYAETASLEELITGDSVQVPESFWNETATSQADNIPEPSNELPIEINQVIDQPIVTEQPKEIELEPIATETYSPPASDLTLEVVKIDDPIEEIVDAHASVGTDEPYDPSLELRNYKFPTLDLLEQRSNEDISIDKNELELNKNQIINTLKSFGISIAKISATVGPTVTLYEIVPAEGVRISKIRNLEDDIALSLSALGIRIIAPIPGRGTIGIEVPNLKKQFVSMRTLIASDKFIHNDFSLPIALGKKIDNENYIVDLAKMPHLLMAGATGQGKSVGINTILVSLLYKKHPSQLKFVMVDPKKVELSIYKVIEKHFLAKLPNEEEAIITDTKKVINTLNALCIEMDNRYDLLKDAGVRNIREYNEKFIKRKLLPTKGHMYLPFIVLVVDEFADLIMTAGKEVEMPIARIAQLARAVGIHCIVATQRPSVNVITGTIKANFPARVAFKVSAKVDSRTILDAGGAEQLIGQGDMLILNGSELVRIQCAFVDTPEVERIVEFIGNQQGYPTAFDLPEYEGADGGDLAGGGGAKSLKDVDQMFEQCARLVVTSGSGSTSMLQRRFNLGYNRAGRIMDQMEAAGIVGASTGGKPRELMVHSEAELEEVMRAIGILN